MADFGVKIDLAALKAVEAALLGSPARKAITAQLEEVAGQTIAGARAQWPADRSPKSGLPRAGSDYAYQAKKKGHNLNEHSVDLFGQRTEQTPTTVRVVIFNRASWAYKIRSRQIGLMPGQRIAWARRKRGESIDDYYARIGSGAKPKHAWGVLVRAPALKANKALADRLAADLAEVANGR